MFFLIGFLLMTLFGIVIVQIYEKYTEVRNKFVVGKNKHLLFSYGSNSIKQLKSRLDLKDDVKYYNAYITDYIRIFAGISKKWGGGGVASIYPSKGAILYGIAVELTELQLNLLDTYESGYERRIIKCVVENEEYQCHVYIKKNNQFKSFPSDDYLRAINTMLNDRENNEDRKIFIRGVIKNKIINFGFWTKKDGLLLKFNRDINIKCM